MRCSASFLGINVMLWHDPFIVQRLVQSYKNLSDGDTYDCGLTIVPCESPITNAVISMDANLISLFDVIVVYTVLALLVLLGIIGNISNIIIFSKYNIANDSTNNFLLGLSVSDLMNTLSNGLTVSISYLCFFDESQAITAYNIIEPRVFILTRMFSLLSLDLVTFISIQRAVAVVFPFKISTILSNRNTYIIIASLVIACVSFFIPLQALFYANWIFHPYFDKLVSLGNTFLIDYNISMDVTTAYFMTRSVFDLVCISITASVTVYKLKRQAKNRSKLTTGEKPTSRPAEMKVIKLSLTVCLVTFTIYSLSISVNGVFLVLSDQLFRSGLPIPAEFFSMALQMINSSFNFFLYLRMSTKYRNIFRNSLKGKVDGK